MADVCIVEQLTRKSVFWQLRRLTPENEGCLSHSVALLSHSDSCRRYPEERLPCAPGEVKTPHFRGTKPPSPRGVPLLQVRQLVAPQQELYRLRCTRRPCDEPPLLQCKSLCSMITKAEVGHSGDNRPSQVELAADTQHKRRQRANWCPVLKSLRLL